MSATEIVMLRGADDTNRLDIVREAVERINGIRDDDEKAHAHEDALHVAVLRAIVNGAPDASRLAFEALKTLEIDFSRRCG